MSESSTVRNGSCLCGKIRVRLDGPPVQSVLCHCTSCQKSCGSVFEANLFCKKTQVQILDPDSRRKGYQDSSPDNGGTVLRSFCSDCGSNICIENLTNEAILPFIILPVGIFDGDRTGLKPTHEYFVKRTVDWFQGVQGSQHLQGMT